MDPHMETCVSEHREDEPKPCTECGKDSQCHASWEDGDGFICRQCVDEDEREQTKLPTEILVVGTKHPYGGRVPVGCLPALFADRIPVRQGDRETVIGCLPALFLK